MLGRSFRIRKKEDFERVFRTGKPLFFNDLGCRAAFRREPGFRVGFSFAKKHLPLATERHRLRRRLSEALLAHKKTWPDGYDVVFFTQRRPKDVNYATIEQIATQCINAINTLNKGK